MAVITVRTPALLHAARERGFRPSPLDDGDGGSWERGDYSRRLALPGVEPKKAL